MAQAHAQSGEVVGLTPYGERLAELRSLERDLRGLRERCDGSDDQCHIIEALHQRADESAVPEGVPPLRRRHL